MARPSDYLVHGDARRATGALPAEVRFDLVYLDPPYGVGTTMTARDGKGQTRGRRGPQSGPSAYVDSSDVEALVSLISEVASSLRGRMNPDAMLCVHLDQRAVHETKVALDAVFGKGAFAGEIIWVPGNGAKGKGVPMTHQTLLLFGKTATSARRWNVDHPTLRESYSATSLKMHFRNQDASGRYFRERIINGKAYRYYADEGRRLGSVWTDIPAMRANTPLHAEGTGYPTQKPLLLLERLILAMTVEGERVADLMCGSGTTLVAASRLGRSFVGADASPVAIKTSASRLAKEGIDVSLLDELGRTASAP